MGTQTGWPHLALVFCLGALAQSPGSFEVSSVKPIPPNTPQRPPRIDQQSFTLSGSLYSFIADAYNLRPCVRKEASSCALISGEPSWTKKDRFEIRATLPANVPAFTRFEFADGDAPQLDRMLRTLLEDRFKLVAHSETKELPVYSLVALKRGPKLKAVTEQKIRTAADGTSFKIHGLDELDVQSGNGNLVTRFGFRYTSMREFSSVLTSLLDRPVLDRTGIDGKFDFALEQENAADSPTDPGSLGRFAGPALFTAIQEQLGLKLEATTGPVPVLVIDHVERPSSN